MPISTVLRLLLTNRKSKKAESRTISLWFDRNRKSSLPSGKDVMLEDKPSVL
jgi:hypothetical protein